MKRSLFALSTALLVGLSTSSASAAGGFLGVQLADEIPEAVLTHLGIDGGAMILNVVPNTAAAKAGLQRHDVITKVNKVAVKSANGLRKAISSHGAGTDVSLEVRRGAKKFSVVVKLGGPPGAAPPAKPKEKGFLGVQYGAVPPILAKHLKLKPGTGLVVRAALPGSGAAKAGIEVDDVLVKVNGQSITALELPPAFPGLPADQHKNLQKLLEQHPQLEQHTNGLGIDVDGDGDIDVQLPDGSFDARNPGSGWFRYYQPNQIPSVQSNLAALIGKHFAGDTVSVELIHRGDAKTVQVTLGKKPANPPPPVYNYWRSQPPQSHDRYFLGTPQSKTSGKIRWRDADGTIQEHELDFGGDHKKLIERFRKHKAPSGLIEELEKAMKKLNTELESPEIELHLESLESEIQKSTKDLDRVLEELHKQLPEGQIKSKNVSTSEARILSNGTDISVKSTNGVKTITVKKDGKLIAEDLPYDKRDALPADVQKLLEGISIEQSSGGSKASGSIKEADPFESTPKKVDPKEKAKKIKA